MIHQRARAGIAGLVAVATASTAVLTSSAVAASAQSPARPAHPGGPTTVTLVTGDVVTLGGQQGVRITAAPGREHIGFRTHTDPQGDTHVVPADALTAVSAGRVDPRLFDVSELARAGYGDADRADLPLIVDYPGATPRTAGTRTVRELPSMSAAVLRADKDSRFWAAAGTSANKIWLDGKVRANLDRSVAQIGAPEAWEAGHTGKGTTVAVLDTGIDATHPDLSDAVADAKDFTESESGVDDRFGHGTHVASIITGAGERYRGVAPDATLLNGKVLDDNGGGYESGIIAGMEWAANGGADVINMSLGGGPTDGTDPMSQAVNQLSADTGALFVIAAGNSGSPESIGSPGSADAALTVGAVDRDDQLAEFSSRGPRAGDGAIKPDITAPGVGIVAAEAANAVIGEPVEDGYIALDGTSMATPHVAGAAAILAGVHPDWTGDRLKATLMASAAPNAELSVFEQGTGRVDVAAAVTSTVSAAPASLSLGVTQWPHEDDQPIAKTLTYTNSGTEPISMSLATDLRGPDGAASPAGMFTLSASELTVPAGGSAEVTLTTDTRVEAENGVHSGTVVATAGDTVVRTPVAVTREVESYDITLTFLDHNGAPTPEYSFRFVDVNNPNGYNAYDESGTVVARVPKGEFYFDGWVQTPTGGRSWLTTDLTEPKVVVTGPAEFVFDARDGVRPGFTVDDPDAKAGRAQLSYLMTTSWGETGSMSYLPGFDNLWVRPSRSAVPGAFEFSAEAKLAEPDGTGVAPGFHASPYLYNLRRAVDGQVPAELNFRVTNQELAKVSSTHAVATPGTFGVREDFVTMPLPHTLTEYYTPDTEWFGSFYETSTSWTDGYPPPVALGATDGAPRSYRLGTSTKERWNVGVFSPGLPANQYSSGGDIARSGDSLAIQVSLFGDQNLWRTGYHAGAVGGTEVLRDGEVIARSEYPGYLEAALPPEQATYTVRASATQPGPLSTTVEAEWTFASAHAGVEWTPVPALVVRYAPNLDEHNAAPAGRKFRFPVNVQRNGAESPGRVDPPTVEVSFDDGKTWGPATLSRSRGGWTAEVEHPGDAEFVSLRSSVADGDGNVAKQTVIHAYALTS
ncbi:S8 family serine peptidase [Actinophytocola sediminis]